MMPESNKQTIPGVGRVLFILNTILYCYPFFTERCLAPDIELTLSIVAQACGIPSPSSEKRIKNKSASFGILTITISSIELNSLPQFKIPHMHDTRSERVYPTSLYMAGRSQPAKGTSAQYGSSPQAKLCHTTRILLKSFLSI